MKRTWLSALLALLRPRSAARPIKSGEQYASSFGDFRCGPFSLPTTAEAAFGPHGGTVLLKDELERTRIDVEEFAPPLDTAALAEMRDAVYQGYLKDNILPLVQSGVPQAKLLDARLAIIKGRGVLQSAILMPALSPYVSPDGKRFDGIRGQVQYTNGRFMFTVSRITPAWPDHAGEKQLEIAYRAATEAYGLCDFPQ